MAEQDRFDSLAGCLLGGAIGDALGLPFEGISRTRAARLAARPIRHQFLLGKGMVSDDTEHACITGIALARSDRCLTRFERELAKGMRAWFLTIPAGIGLATLKSALKLCAGIPPGKSGVPSAGNGPAMRAPIIGAYFEHDRPSIRAFSEASARMTHTNPRAIDGALLVALAAAGCSLEDLRGAVQTDCWCFDQIESHLGNGSRPSDFARSMGLERGVSGFIGHTVPVALYCSLRWPNDYPRAIEDALGLGGDSDTLCAIVGGIVGARVGCSRLPEEWMRGLWEFPRSVSWMNSLARAMSEGSRPPSTFWFGYLARTPLFIATVLAHGFRRLFPPYG